MTPPHGGRGVGGGGSVGGGARFFAGSLRVSTRHCTWDIVPYLMCVALLQKGARSVGFNVYSTRAT